MLWLSVFTGLAAAASPSEIRCRPSLSLQAQSVAANGKTSLLFRPSCGSLDTTENSLAVFESRSDLGLDSASGPGSGSDADPLAVSGTGNITEDGITVDIDPSTEVITIVGSSAHGEPIFHTLNLATEAHLGSEGALPQMARSSCSSCHAPMCQSSCQPPLPQSCSFYRDCAEASLHCGSEGYPIRYGDKNCRGFLDRLSHFSGQGQTWIFKVLTCLQQALLQPLNEQCSLTCDQLFDEAFKSHPACYADSGVCFLPLGDLVQIVITVGSDLVYGPALEQALSAGGKCVEKYIEKIEEAIEEAKTAGETAKRILYEGVKKFLEAIS